MAEFSEISDRRESLRDCILSGRVVLGELERIGKEIRDVGRLGVQPLGVAVATAPVVVNNQPYSYLHPLIYI